MKENLKENFNKNVAAWYRGVKYFLDNNLLKSILKQEKLQHCRLGVVRSSADTWMSK